MIYDKSETSERNVTKVIYFSSFIYFDFSFYISSTFLYFFIFSYCIYYALSTPWNLVERFEIPIGRTSRTIAANNRQLFKLPSSNCSLIAKWQYSCRDYGEVYMYIMDFDSRTQNTNTFINST